MSDLAQPPVSTTNSANSDSPIAASERPLSTSSSTQVHEDKPSKLLFLWALLLIVGGGLLAHFIQTSNGTTIKDIRFAGSDGQIISALLYIPEGVSSENPAPAVVAIHGYINTRETQDAFAIELSRRGYVVLAVDQSGHGYSDGPAFSNGFGGPDSLAYMRTLDFVDKDNIGLEGHSMGGWASVISASSNPQGYQSFVLASSSTGTFGAAEGTPSFPRNMALIFSLYDEFSESMWGAPIAADIVHTDKLKTLFNTSQSVVAKQLYGNIEQGTGRMLFQPAVTHPAVHFSAESIAFTIEWFDRTLEGGKAIASDKQIWIWKEIGTLIALIGMVVLMLASSNFLLSRNYFAQLREQPAPIGSISGMAWWISAAVGIVVSIALYLWSWSFNGQGLAAASYFWPQQITTTLIIWALSSGAISLGLFGLWLRKKAKTEAISMDNYGLSWHGGSLPLRKIALSLLLAFCVIAVAYLSLVISDWLLKIDYRFWIFAIKPLSALQLGIFLAYLLPFTLYFLAAGICLHGQMRPTGKDGGVLSLGRETVINIALLTAPYIVFLLVQYIPLLSGGTLLLSWFSLGSIVMFQFIPVFTIVAILSTWLYRQTGHIYVGAFINAMLVTWLIVAGQATHYAY